MSRQKRNADLEVLRAIAIAYTLAAHLLWPALPKLGRIGRAIQPHLQFWTGVDLFFAISGFIITTSLLKTVAAGRPAGEPASGRAFRAAAVPFWVRRVFRLLPSAWLWIAVTLLLAARFNAGNSFGPLARNVAEAEAAVLQAANFYFYAWFAHGHRAIGSLGAYWSLSLEEQFYLLLPFLLFFVRRRLLTALLAAAFFLQALVPRPIGFSPESANLAWFVRTDALILGVLIALDAGHRASHAVGQWIGRHPRLTRTALCAAALGLLAVPAMPAIEFCSTGLVAVLSALLVLAASFDRDYVCPPGAAKDALVWLGSRSYSIYLIHIAAWALVIEFKKRIGIAEGGGIALALSVVALVFTLGLAELNFRFVETTFRRMGRGISERLEGRLRRNPAPGPEGRAAALGAAEPRIGPRV